MNILSTKDLFRIFFVFTFLSVALALFNNFFGCIDSVCYTNKDCPKEETCNVDTGKCIKAIDPVECTSDTDCEENFICVDQRCIPHGSEPLNCPEGMVSIEDAFCIDIYEASRPDASVNNPGNDGSYATSRPGVLPWETNTQAEALTACLAAGKDLCTESEWLNSCKGPNLTKYTYGNTYSATICNGIDKFCYCQVGQPHCFEECSAAFHLLPAGECPSCTNDYGTFDMNGNLWEYTKDGNGTRVRGGAYNCRDSEELHQCDYIPTYWTPSARGFRCCLRPEE